MDFRQKLVTGLPLLGTFLKTPSPMICETLGRSDLDVVCIDAEHAPFDRRDIDACLLACRSVGIPSVVRIPATSPEHILNALDLGADGFIAPHIVTSEDAEFIAAKAQFGRGRGYAGGTRAAKAKNMADHVRDSRESTVVIGQIEDIEAMDDLDDILAVEGIDCFFIGRSDLTISMGLTDPNDPAVIKTVETICDKARKKNRIVGTFTANLDEVTHWRKLGVSLFLLGSDHSFMLKGAKDFCSDVRARF